jgi:hypothetical protein
MIEIGANYPEHATPMLDYFFYGPGFPECDSSSNENNCQYETCRLFGSSQSMQEMLQTSYDKAGCATSNSMSLSAFVPPGRLDAISGPTVTELFGLSDYLGNEATPSLEVKIIRKDLNFRWSMLSIEEGQFDDAPDSETCVPVGARYVDHEFEKFQSPNSKTIIQQSCGLGRHDLKVGSVAVAASLKHLIPTLNSSPCQKAFRREFKLPINFNGLASESNAYIDPPMLSPTKRKDSTQTTVPPSLLGLGLFVEDERGLTSISSVVGPGLPFWISSQEVFASDAFWKNHLYAIQSTLGNSVISELVSSLPPATSGTTPHAEDGSSDRISSYGHSDPVDWDRFSFQMEDNADKTLVSISSPVEYPTWSFQTLHGRAVAQIRILLKRTARFTRLTSGWVKHIWSATRF